MDDDLSVGIEQTYKNEKLLRFISFVLGCLLTIGILCISSKYNNDFFTLTIKETTSHRFIRKTLSKITGESNDKQTKWGIEREFRRKVKEIEGDILEEYRGKQETLKQEYDEKVRDLKLEKEKSSNQLKIEFDKEKLKLDTEKKGLFEHYEKENNDVKNDVEKQIKELKQEKRRLEDKEREERLELIKKGLGKDNVQLNFPLFTNDRTELLKKKRYGVVRKIDELNSILVKTGFKFDRNRRTTKRVHKEKLVELKKDYKIKEGKLNYKKLLTKLKMEFDKGKKDLRLKKQQLKSGKLKILVLEQNKEEDRLNRVLFKKESFNKKLSYVFWVLLCVGGFYLSWFYRELVSKLMIKIGLNTQHYLRRFIEKV